MLACCACKAASVRRPRRRFGPRAPASRPRRALRPPLRARVTSGRNAALEALGRHADAEAPVAAVFSADNGACGGKAFWADVHELHPSARRVLMVGRGEWNKAHPAVTAMRAGHAESYIFVPWGPRERWLYL